jgi:hypothetical protein
MVLGVVAAVVGKVRPQRKEATLIDGKKIAATITAEVKADVDKIREQTGKVRTPRRCECGHARHRGCTAALASLLSENRSRTPCRR